MHAILKVPPSLSLPVSVSHPPPATAQGFFWNFRFPREVLFLCFSLHLLRECRICRASTPSIISLNQLPRSPPESREHTGPAYSSWTISRARASSFLAEYDHEKQVSINRRSHHACFIYTAGSRMHACISYVGPEGSLPDPRPDRPPREAGGEGRLSTRAQGGGERVQSKP